MVDILFIQQQLGFYFGIISLSSYLKHNNYSCEILIDSVEQDIIKSVKQLNPSVIGISCMSNEHNWLINITNKLKKNFPDKIIIVGGIHGILYFKEILNDCQVDLVCHSEGEYVLPHVINSIRSNSLNWREIEGLVYRNEKNEIISNARAKLFEFQVDIVESKEIYFKRYPQLEKISDFSYISSRGCPFSCNFCYNSLIKDTFKGKGKYVRFKPVNNLIAEIKADTQAYKVNFITFKDDLFTANTKWLNEFLEIYKTEINLPYYCASRADYIDEKNAVQLAQSGCKLISFGLETGDFDLRKQILNKSITDDEIIKCGHILNQNGILVETTNMFCLPEETLDKALKTIALNQKAKVDFALAFVLVVYPDTQLAKYCIEKGYLPENYTLKNLPYFGVTATSLLNISNKTSLMNIQKLLFYFVRWKWTFIILKPFIKFRWFTPFANMLYHLSDILHYKLTRNYNIFQTIHWVYTFGMARLRRILIKQKE